MQEEKKLDFNKVIKELEEINDWFQNEEINLDEGLVKFRRGLELIKKCRQKLKEVENELIEIKKEFTQDVDEPEEEEVSEDSGTLFLKSD